MKTIALLILFGIAIAIILVARYHIKDGIKKGIDERNPYEKYGKHYDL